MQTELAQKQILLTTTSGTHTGSIFSLKLVKPKPDQAASSAENKQEDENEQSTSIRSTNSNSNNKDEIEKKADKELKYLLEADDDNEKKNTNNDEETSLVKKKNKNNGETTLDDDEFEGTAGKTNSNGSKKDEGGVDENNDESNKNKGRNLRVFPPLVVMIPDLFDLPEPSYKPLAENLLRFGICHSILVPHLRGFEPSSVQKDLVYSGYTLAEIAVDIINWMDEVVLKRKYVSSIGGVILVGHGFYGSLLCEVVNAVFWGRRELTISTQPGSGFWRSHPKDTDNTGATSNNKDGNGEKTTAQEEQDNEAQLQLQHTKNFLIRGMIFINSAPPANLIHEVATYRKILFKLKSIKIFIFVMSLSMWLWLALIFPPVFVENRIPKLITQWWRSNEDDEVSKKKKSQSVARHIVLGGTERWIRFPDKVKKPEDENNNNSNNSSSAVANTTIKDETCDNTYVSSILRSRSSPVGCCQKALSSHIVSFASLFNRFGAQHDVWNMLNNLAETRAGTVENVVFNMTKHKNKSLEEGSLMMLYQLTRVRGAEQNTPWETIAPLVPVLCLMPEDLSKNPLGVPAELQKRVLNEKLKCEEFTTSQQQKKLGSEDKNDEKENEKNNNKKVVASSPCSTVSTVTLLGESSYWMHEKTATASKELEDEDRGKYLMSSQSFLCALSIAKFIRRGMLYESVLEEKNAERQQQNKAGGENNEQDGGEKGVKRKEIDEATTKKKSSEALLEKMIANNEDPAEKLRELSEKMEEAKSILNQRKKAGGGKKRR